MNTKSKSDRLPWFPFFAKDWLDIKVLSMTLEEQGAYFRMLVHCWADSPDQCSITSDPKLLARLLGISPKKTARILSTFNEKCRGLFVLDADGFYRSLKLQRIREDAAKLSSARSIAGKVGADSRWQNDSKRIANASQDDGKGHGKGHGKAMAKDGYIQLTSTVNNNSLKQQQLKSEGDEGIPEHLKDLVFLAQQAKVPNKLATLIRYLDAWVVRVGHPETERILTQPGARGLSVIELQNTYFVKSSSAPGSDVQGMIQRALATEIESVKG